MDHISKFRIVAASLLLISVSSCGGEDAPAPVVTPPETGGGGGGGGSPSSDPPATTNLPPAPFGLAASSNFEMVGYQYISEEGKQDIFALAEEKATLSWSAPDKTYRISLVDLGSGKLVYTFEPSNNSAAFSIVQADGTIAKTYVTAFVKGENSGEIFWRTADGIRPYVYASAIFGLPVPSDDLPISGGKVFVTDPSLQTKLVFDFATRKVSGTITNRTSGGGFYPPGEKEVGTIDPTDILPDGTFVASMTVSGAPNGGELRGRLFGSSANELGVYWNAPARTDEGAWTQLQSALRYEVCSSCS